MLHHGARVDDDVVANPGASTDHRPRQDLHAFPQFGVPTNMCARVYERDEIESLRTGGEIDLATNAWSGDRTNAVDQDNGTGVDRCQIGTSAEVWDPIRDDWPSTKRNRRAATKCSDELLNDSGSRRRPGQSGVCLLVHIVTRHVVLCRNCAYDVPELEGGSTSG